MKKIVVLIISFFIIQAQEFEVSYKKTIEDLNFSTHMTILNGNYILLDSENSLVYKYNELSGIINSNGGFGWKNSQFDEPSAICSDLLRIYISDKNNNRIQIFDKDLNYISSIISTEKNYFEYPGDCQISSSGNLYFVDSENQILYKYFPQRNELVEILDIKTSNFELENIEHFYLDQNENVYLLQNNSIVLFDSFGTGLRKVELPFSPKNICINQNKIFLVSGKKVFISPLTNNINFTELIEVGNDISDLVIAKNYLHLLFQKSIKVYKIEESSN